MNALTRASRESHQLEVQPQPDERAELEALIEEARRRARRRRTGLVAGVSFVVLLAVGLYVLLSAGGGRPTDSSAARSAARLTGSHRTGILTGLIRSAIQPSDPAYSGLPGHVIVFEPSGRVVARAELHGFGHHFQLALPAGRYQINEGSKKAMAAQLRTSSCKRTTPLTSWSGSNARTIEVTADRTFSWSSGTGLPCGGACQRLCSCHELIGSRHCEHYQRALTGRRGSGARVRRARGLFGSV